jgi:hypothetical protein
MSGKDERVIDIPICPKCGEMPSYWSLFPKKTKYAYDGWAIVFSKVYLLEEGFDRGRVVYSGTCKSLDEIVSIKCRPQGYCGAVKSRHSFAENTETFKQVMRLARRLER